MLEHVARGSEGGILEVVSRFGVVLLVLAVGGCRAESRKHPPNLVARVGDRIIDVRAVEAEIDDRAPGFRAAKYQSPAKREELLESMVRFELLAAEAERRGLAQDPRVVRAARKEMVAALLRKEIDEQLDPRQVDEAEVERRYRERVAEFEIPEQVRVSQILMRDPVRANKVAAQARAARRPDRDKDEQGFRDLVARFSEDPTSRARGGDVGTWTRASPAPAALLDAALELSEVGHVSPAVQTAQGFHILKLVQRAPASTRPLSEVRGAIVQELLGTKRNQKLDQLIASLRGRARTEIFKEALATVRVPSHPSPPP